MILVSNLVTKTTFIFKKEIKGVCASIRETCCSGLGVSQEMYREFRLAVVLVTLFIASAGSFSNPEKCGSFKAQ